MYTVQVRAVALGLGVLPEGSGSGPSVHIPLLASWSRVPNDVPYVPNDPRPSVVPEL